MDKQKKNNFKKLLCYNIVNNIKCVYKNKCMFAHNLNEQLKEPLRDFIYSMIYTMGDLSNINIKENKELFEELMIFTKECKNCINKKCPGGYNCKFGVCIKDLRICYNDLLNGKCISVLNEEIVDGKTVKRCICGIHLTEKNLIPYYQRISCEINVLDFGVFFFNNINYYNKINTVSIMLNDESIKLVKNLITKNKISKSDVLTKINYWDKYNVNYFVDNNKTEHNNESIDNNIFEDDNIINEYQYEKISDSMNSINDYFWRYQQCVTATKTEIDNEIENVMKLNNNTDDSNYLSSNLLNTKLDDLDLDNKIKNIIKTMDEIDTFDIKKVH
jgi:hypothetical protein